jgi:hypothetical protein
VVVIKAAGDDSSAVDGTPATVLHLAADHYGALKEHGVTELAQAIRTTTKEF